MVQITKKLSLLIMAVFTSSIIRISLYGKLGFASVYTLFFYHQLVYYILKSTNIKLYQLMCLSHVIHLYILLSFDPVVFGFPLPIPGLNLPVCLRLPRKTGQLQANRFLFLQREPCQQLIVSIFSKTQLASHSYRSQVEPGTIPVCLAT
jgi:hypothetical protein